jgi:signal transduction histidine kinase
MTAKEAGHRGDFSAQLSELRHDIRTPLGHIIGYAEMIEEDLFRRSAGDTECWPQDVGSYRGPFGGDKGVS